jgi:hypothetical protein
MGLRAFSIAVIKTKNIRGGLNNIISLGDLVKIVYIVWFRYNRRAELLAQNLGAKIFYIVYGKRGRTLQTLVKYPIQAWRTWLVLRRERPRIIFVQNPPIFCALVAFIYSSCHRARYVIDSHTGAFLLAKWRWSLRLHRWLSRRALATIVHNVDQEKIIETWDCPYCVLGFTPGSYSGREPFPLDRKFNIAVICNVAEDKWLADVFDAAVLLPDVCFYITGDSQRIPKPLLMRKPENCRLTGYLPYGQYVSLLAGANAIMDLHDSDHTLLLGGFEAVSLGKVLITSDWPLLRGYFSLGTVYVRNTAQSILEGVHRVQKEESKLQRDMVRLRDMLEAEWKRQFGLLLRLLREA